MAPKCGTTTIAHMLNVDLHHSYTCEEINNLNNPEYKKLIIIRNIIDRFLSGFYEDFFECNCYDNMDITFNDYLLFLYKCYTEKIPNVNTIHINNVNIPVWWGKGNNNYLNLTNNNGEFCSHIQQQKYAISHITNNIKCNNIELIDLSNLSYIIKVKNKNVNLKQVPFDFDLSTTSLSYMKKNKIIISSIYLTSEQIKIIFEMYSEDIEFIEELEKKYKYLDIQTTTF
jgi:hypothetical protein